MELPVYNFLVRGSGLRGELPPSCHCLHALHIQPTSSQTPDQQQR
jgi:hypothetical protein